MTRVSAIILHAVPGPGAGPLERAFERTRKRLAARHVDGFAAAGASASIVESTGSQPFGRRLRDLAAGAGGGGLVVLGSGSLPLATRGDRAALVAAASGARRVLVNNRFSADVLALSPDIDLRALPDVAADNGVPAWLASQGVVVDDLARRWRLQVDLDSPLDAILASGSHEPGQADGIPPLTALDHALAGLRTAARDPFAEIIVAGRSSATTLRWLEGHTDARTRALVEERGFKTAPPGQRPTRSSLGLLLDREGPAALGLLLAQLGDAAVIDTRVLLAHRFGRDETGWPAAEDRFASDLLLASRIADPWLRALTEAAATAPIPVVLGGHTLVGPGLRLALRRPIR